MGKNYSAKDYNKENMARAIGKSLPISFKQSIEICDFIRDRDVHFAKDALSKVTNQELAIPFKRFNKGVGHKKNIASGRYPKNASREFLNLINHVEANAQFKGLNTSNLVITHIIPNKASTVLHYGRKRSRKSKRTNVEIVVQEMSKDKKSINKTNIDKKVQKPQEKNTLPKKTENKKLETKPKTQVKSKK